MDTNKPRGEARPLIRTADRTLMRAPITPANQAEAYFLLATRLIKTTGQIVTVDDGLHEAFLR